MFQIKEDDLIYFKMTDSSLSVDWRFGRVQYAVRDIEWKNSMIERPVRAVVKLMNVEDTSLLEDMRKVKELVEEILVNKISNKEMEIPDDHMDSTENAKDLSDADGPEADDAVKVPEVFEKSKVPEVFEKSKVPEVFEESKSKPPDVCEKSKSKPKHVNRDVKKAIRGRKTEVEKLLEDETKISPEHMNRTNRRKKKNADRVQNNSKMSSTMMPKNSANISPLIIACAMGNMNQDTTEAVREVAEQGVRTEGLLRQVFRDMND